MPVAGGGPGLIREERPADVDAIRSIHEACFPTGGEARLVDLLRAAGHLTVSLVGEVDGGVVGHVGFSPVTAASGDCGLGLAPVAVLEPYRRRGIGASLIAAGLAVCRTQGVGWVVVLGAPEYYSRFGFRPAGDAGLVDEYGGGAAFQVMELTAAAPFGRTGLVRYGPEFASLG